MTSGAHIADTVNLLGEYDRAFVQLLRSAPLRADGLPVPIVRAPIERAWAVMGSQHEGQVGHPGEELIRGVLLPSISFSHADVVFDPSRFHGRRVYFRGPGHLGSSEDLTRSGATQFPLPYNVTYRAEFWAKTLHTYDVLQVWSGTLYREGHEMWLTVDYSPLDARWGQKLISFANNGFIDNSDLEGADQDRVLRFTLTTTAKAWFPFRIGNIKNILTLLVDSYFIGPNDELISAD